MKLMLKDTVIFLFSLATFCLPYAQLFIRIKNYNTPLDQCDPYWNNTQSASYNIFLMMFNMFNFQTSEVTNNQETTQLYVSSNTFL